MMQEEQKSFSAPFIVQNLIQWEAEMIFKCHFNAILSL